MNNDELVAAFEAGKIAPAAFSHENHVRVAWGLARQYGEQGGLERLVVGIKALAVRAGKPHAFHVTLTRAWFDLIASVEDLDAAPELLEKSIIKRFYSADRIAEGRELWLEPDLHPLQLPLPPLADDSADATH
jgi:2'-5' RNA ligase